MSCFPDRVPVLILMNTHDHRQPYPGDHGIRFEPIAESQAAATPTVNEPREATEQPRKTSKGRGRVPR